MSHHRKGISRRQFLKNSATAAAVMSLQWKRMLMAAPPIVGGPYGMVSPALTKFKDPIRGIGGTGIPLAQPDGISAPTTSLPEGQHYSIDIGQFNDVLHSDFITPGKAAYIPSFSGTKLWGYGQTGTAKKHLGGIIVASRNTPVQITFNNNLPGTQIIPNDTTHPPACRPDDGTAPPSISTAGMSTGSATAARMTGGRPDDG